MKECYIVIPQDMSAWSIGRQGNADAQPRAVREPNYLVIIQLCFSTQWHEFENCINQDPGIFAISDFFFL